MIARFAFFALFLFTLFIGVSVFFPRPQPLPAPQQMVKNNDDDETPEETDTKEYQKLNMKTVKGIVQIHRQMDDLTREQTKLVTMLDDDQQALNVTDQEIAAVLKQINGKNDLDVLRLKALGLELQSNQRLLIDRGQYLIAFNNQLNKSRLWLAQQNELLNFNNDQSATIFDKVTQQNNDIMEHTKDLMDKERQKVEDQQSR